MQRQRTILGSEDFPVRCSKFGIALSWDVAPGRHMDVDLQAVAFDYTGKLIDAVYYNNLKALGRGMTHSGDETTGVKGGFDEAVWIHFSRLPETVSLFAFVVACYSGGALRDAANGMFHVLEENNEGEVGHFRLEESTKQVDLVGALLRGSDGSWTFRLIEEPAQAGQHFIDILEPTIGNFVRRVIPGAPRRLKAAFAMEKGSVVDLPRTNIIRNVKACLGWDTTKGECDLDVSAVLLNRHGALISTVFFGNEEEKGVRHSGDNLTGQGEGDDEIICVDLEALPHDVGQVFFLINIYTNGRSFADVANPYCRIVTADGDEFCRYLLQEAGRERGLIVARLLREPGDSRWGFQAIGVPCPGMTWKDSMSSLLPYAQKRPQDLQLTRSFSSVADFAPPPPPAATLEYVPAGTALPAPPDDECVRAAVAPGPNPGLKPQLTASRTQDLEHTASGACNQGPCAVQ
eukprot:gnl/TRDRNA2_/TRDRNA2_196868_c0_seq1.p1 gnl/TRDRNA2_/TRDRNA2_196868_c0~~gnl/TRDRNA2_/TRDRNA2_196868_c0_seq1.p1  ORF type:complete len:461 (+),score=71.51 gnl/TRDRNA2_/TRDRNA2_196868_c0_seq1:89-1471(+)